MRGVRVKLPAGTRIERWPRRASKEASVMANPAVATPMTCQVRSAPI